MRSKSNLLKLNDTWMLIKLSKMKKVMARRWVFKMKPRLDGSTLHFKSQWVAKGFLQKHGIDFNETFPPVAK
jgi:hypothetical protein